MTVNERVRYLRKEVLGLTQEQFGAELHLRQQAIGMLETCSGVTGRNIAAICERWNVREERLRTGEGDIFSRPHAARSLAGLPLGNPIAMREAVISAYLDLPPELRKAFLQEFARK